MDSNKSAKKANLASLLDQNQSVAIKTPQQIGMIKEKLDTELQQGKGRFSSTSKCIII